MTHFTRIVENITAPKHLIPTFQKNIHLFSLQALLVEAIDYMKFKEFSQVVVQTKDGLSLLSLESIALWFAEQLKANMSIAKVSIVDALVHEHSDSGVFMARNALVDDAREAFSGALSHTHPRPMAIIITNTGKHTEQPLGIITAWDLLQDI